MSVPEIAALEAAWRASGDPKAEARWLVARVKSGKLSQERLQLAVHLGYPPARLCFGRHAPPEVQDLAKWVRGIDRYGKDALLRAAIAGARYALPLWERKRPGISAPAEALRAAEACALESSPEAFAACERAAEAVAQANGGAVGDDTSPSLAAQTYDADMGVVLAADMAAEAAHFAADMGEAEDIAQAMQTAELVLGVAARVGQLKGTLRDAIREELVPWTLGYSDPLRAPRD